MEKPRGLQIPPRINMEETCNRAIRYLEGCNNMGGSRGLPFLTKARVEMLPELDISLVALLSYCLDALPGAKTCNPLCAFNLGIALNLTEANGMPLTPSQLYQGAQISTKMRGALSDHICGPFLQDATLALSCAAAVWLPLQRFLSAGL
jgi:hypothetical protein